MNQQTHFQWSCSYPILANWWKSYLWRRPFPRRYQLWLRALSNWRPMFDIFESYYIWRNHRHIFFWPFVLRNYHKRFSRSTPLSPRLRKRSLHNYGAVRELWTYHVMFVRPHPPDNGYLQKWRMQCIYIWPGPEPNGYHYFPFGKRNHSLFLSSNPTPLPRNNNWIMIQNLGHKPLRSVHQLTHAVLRFRSQIAPSTGILAPHQLNFILTTKPANGSQYATLLWSPHQNPSSLWPSIQRFPHNHTAVGCARKSLYILRSSWRDYKFSS